MKSPSTVLDTGFQRLKETHSNGNRNNTIRNEHTRGTLKVGRFGQKVRQSRLRWYGHVKRQDDDNVGRKILEIRRCSCQGKKTARMTKQGGFGCGEGGGYAGGRSEQYRPPMGKVKRRMMMIKITSKKVFHF